MLFRVAVQVWCLRRAWSRVRKAAQTEILNVELYFSRQVWTIRAERSNKMPQSQEAE